jgi:hypothetical protein
MTFKDPYSVGDGFWCDPIRQMVCGLDKEELTILILDGDA